MPELRFRKYQLQTAWNETTGAEVQVRAGAPLKPGLTLAKPSNAQAAKAAKTRPMIDLPVSTQTAEELATMTVAALEKLPEWERVADKAGLTSKDAKIAAILKVRGES